VLGLVVAAGVFETVLTDCIVTAISDGKHKRGSAHCTGRAADLRSHHLPDLAEKHDVLEMIRTRLGVEWDVLFEAQGTPGEHFHIEWDPKE